MAAPADSQAIVEADLAALPEAAGRYLRFMDVVGRPRVRSFRLAWTGRFRTGPDRPWMACRAVQRNTGDPITRVFRMSMRFGGVLPVVAHDTYAGGAGRMRAKVLDLLTVVDERGHELDVGELVTWLNDAILFAPSMLIDARAVWAAVDADAFDVTLTDHGTAVTGRVFIDGRGAPRDFSTTDRFVVEAGKRVAARWTTPIDAWQTVAGRSLPVGARAVWHMAERTFVYADFRLEAERSAFDASTQD